MASVGAAGASLDLEGERIIAIVVPTVATMPRIGVSNTDLSTESGGWVARGVWSGTRVLTGSGGVHGGGHSADGCVGGGQSGKLQTKEIFPGEAIISSIAAGSIRSSASDVSSSAETPPSDIAASAAEKSTLKPEPDGVRSALRAIGEKGLARAPPCADAVPPSHSPSPCAFQPHPP